jgi:transposase InsO family protein
VEIEQVKRIPAESWFVNLDEMQEKVQSWRRNYNEERPHSSLGNATPEAFAAFIEPQKAAHNREIEVATNELAYSKSC